MKFALTDCFLIYSINFDFDVFINIIICLIISEINDITQVFIDFTSINNINISEMNLAVLILYLILLILFFFSKIYF